MQTLYAVEVTCERRGEAGHTGDDDFLPFLLSPPSPAWRLQRAGLVAEQREMVVLFVIALLTAAVVVVYRVGRSLIASGSPQRPSRPATAAEPTPPAARPGRQSVALVVLGDIGRSPRMLYHAESLARHGFQTRIVAHRGALQTPTPFSTLLSAGPAEYLLASLSLVC